MKNLHAVICYWEYKSKKWILAESYGVDEDGNALTIPSTGGNDRQEWLKWTHEKIENEEGYCDNLQVVIPGRAVTIWTFLEGVRLLGLTPPHKTEWLSPSFIEELIKLNNWYIFLYDGWILWFKTSEEARKKFVMFELSQNM